MSGMFYSWYEGSRTSTYGQVYKEPDCVNMNLIIEAKEHVYKTK